jgi:hypothetical protein
MRTEWNSAGMPSRVLPRYLLPFGIWMRSAYPRPPVSKGISLDFPVILSGCAALRHSLPKRRHPVGPPGVRLAAPLQCRIAWPILCPSVFLRYICPSLSHFAALAYGIALLFTMAAKFWGLCMTGAAQSRLGLPALVTTTAAIHPI